jgi:hypothetical protein
MRAFTHTIYAFTHSTLNFSYIYTEHTTYRIPHAHATYSSGRWPLEYEGNYKTPSTSNKINVINEICVCQAPLKAVFT